MIIHGMCGTQYHVVMSPEAGLRSGGNMVISSSGFAIHGGTPIAGWFRKWNFLLKWMITGGIPNLGNLHIVSNNIEHSDFHLVLASQSVIKYDCL